ncbi:MAG: sialate O-acetylesterase, partial [Planctomycetota bacterium]
MRLTIPLSTLSLVLLFLAAGAKAGEVNVWIVAGQSNADGLVNKDTGTTGPIPTAVDSIIGGSNHVYVHHSGGGTSLHPGYTVRPSWHPSVPGQMYADLVVKLDATLTDIRANGDTPVIRAMFWMQGEQDAKASNIHAGLAPPPQPEAANNYDVYLKDLIAAVRGETGAANLPIIIGETTLGDDPDITYPISDYNTPYGEMDYTPIIQAKQAAVAAGDPWAVLVDTDVS